MSTRFDCSRICWGTLERSSCRLCPRRDGGTCRCRFQIHGHENYLDSGRAHIYRHLFLKCRNEGSTVRYEQDFQLSEKCLGTSFEYKESCYKDPSWHIWLPHCMSISLIISCNSLPNQYLFTSYTFQKPAPHQCDNINSYRNRSFPCILHFQVNVHIRFHSRCILCIFQKYIPRW